MSQYTDYLDEAVGSTLSQHFNERQLCQVWSLCAECDLGVEPQDLLALLTADWPEYKEELRKLVDRRNRQSREAERLATLARPA